MDEQKWAEIKAESAGDLDAVKTDEEATKFMHKYFSAEYLPDYLNMYHSLRQELGKQPKEALEQVLSAPPQWKEHVWQKRNTTPISFLPTGKSKPFSCKRS
jgi:hypothetical protein